jgi:glutamine amidotransferase-like uncharacterized protein
LNAQYYRFGKSVNMAGSVVMSLFDQQVKCVYHNGPFFDLKTIGNDVEVISLIEEGVKGFEHMNGKASIISGMYGQGKVVLVGPHPEQTKGLEEDTFRLISSTFRDSS